MDVESKYIMVQNRGITRAVVEEVPSETGRNWTRQQGGRGRSSVCIADDDQLRELVL